MEFIESLDAICGYDIAAMATMRRALLRLGAHDIDALIEDAAPQRCLRVAQALVEAKGAGVPDAELMHALSVLGGDAQRRAGCPQDLPALVIEGRPRTMRDAHGGVRV